MAARFVGFDMTQFLENPEIRTPTMLYLFHRVDELLDGQRVVVDIDEFWKALQDDAFRAFAQDGLKTFRKRNAFMVFGTQSPADALRSPIAHSIIEQTATKILLPNSDAKRSDYRDGLGLTEAEYRLIREDLTLLPRQAGPHVDRRQAGSRRDARRAQGALGARGDARRHGGGHCGGRQRSRGLAARLLRQRKENRKCGSCVP